MRVVLVNAPIRSLVSDLGVGHQMPLGLLMIGGPLRDAGHEVTLVDAARDHLSPADIAARIVAADADVVMTAHVGSTSAHPFALRVLRAAKAARPSVTTVYGGVYPTYQWQQILQDHREVDVIVRGEGEATAVDLVAALASSPDHLDGVAGIAWRAPGGPAMTRGRPPIQDLDGNRIGWELVDDWDRYRSFGMGRSAVVQWSRGCPHACTYCGQWMFWKRWRHRRIDAFVDELEWLVRERDVRFFWLADENPTTDQETWHDVLAAIARRDLGAGMCASIRAKDIVRDAGFLDLYKAAGFVYVLMGVETVTDETLDRIHKGSTVDDAYQAVRLLRRHGILSIVDYIFGLDEESLSTVWRGLRGLHRYDGDYVNALFITPHAWTPLGRAARGTPVVEPDLANWDYRHQILATRHLSPRQLFALVKLVEVAYHLHPRRALRLLTERDPLLRRVRRYSLAHTTLVFWAEIAQRLAHPRPAAPVPVGPSPGPSAPPVDLLA